jgi:hypothetical protein
MAAIKAVDALTVRHVLLVGACAGAGYILEPCSASVGSGYIVLPVGVMFKG